MIPAFSLAIFSSESPSHFLMIEIDRRDDSDIRLNRVGGVESSAQAGFQNDDVDLRVGKIFQRERGGDFEKCRMRIPIADKIANVR